MKYKIGLVGCGRISKNHFEVIESEKRLQLVGVCDIIKERAKEIADHHQVSYFAELKEMLNTVEMDIIAICTPSGLHPRQGIIAAEKGIHIL